MGVKLLCGGRQNRFIDLMIAQNGKDHGSHFPRHMTDDRHVFEPFCGFLLVIRAEHGIALYGDLRRHPDASAQIRRAPFGHMRVRSLELAGLVDRRIDANIGCELVRRRKTGDISDFAENDGSNNRSNAGNRRDRRIKALKQSRYFFSRASAFPESDWIWSSIRRISVEYAPSQSSTPKLFRASSLSSRAFHSPK